MFATANRNVLVKFVIVGLIVLSGMLSRALSQNVEQELPLVLDGKIPVYPLMAREARVQGIVKVRVTTDGKRAASLAAEAGPAMLVKFTKENIQTWEFAKHKPITFVTTFEYHIEDPAQCTFSNGTAVLRLHREALVSANGIETCDPAVKSVSPSVQR